MTEHPEFPVRCFVALTLPDSVRDALDRFTEQLRRTGARASWVRRDNIHLTIQFLGEISVKRLERICRATDAATTVVSPFEFAVEGAGFFGSARSPRVAWAGVPDPPPELHRLQRSIAQHLADVGFEPEKRKFRPHITLGRIRDSGEGTALTSHLSSVNNTTFGTVPVDHLVVLQSHLEPNGVRYSILHESKLKGTEFDGG